MATAKEVLEQVKAGDWAKIHEGENRFRAMEVPKTGIEYWSTDSVTGKSKPKRIHETDDLFVGDIESDQDGKPKISDFMAFPVWVFELKKFQILTLNQKTMINTLNGYRRSKWGELTKYNFIINRVGTTKMDTEYSIMPEPVDPEEEKEMIEIQKKYRAMNVDMEEIYVSKEFPFGGFPLKPKDNSGVVEDALRDIKD